MTAVARVLSDLSPGVGSPSKARRRPKLISIRPPAPPIDIRSAELEMLPARGLGGLPAAFTARMRAVDGSVFHLSTSAADRDALAESGAIALDPEEWEALTLAVEADRAWPADLVQALRARGVTGRLQVDALLDGVSYERAISELGDEGRGLSVARVLGRVGARIDEVWFTASTESASP